MQIVLLSRVGTNTTNEVGNLDDRLKRPHTKKRLEVLKEAKRIPCGFDGSFKQEIEQLKICNNCDLVISCTILAEVIHNHENFGSNLPPDIISQIRKKMKPK